MIELIQALVEKGYAYESDGSVFFRIGEDADYGRALGLRPRARYGRASGSPATTTTRKTCAISSYGRGPRRASPPGTPPGAGDDRAGTSSARR